MRLLPVDSRHDLRDFLALTGRVYGDDPRHVPPLRQQIRGWFRGEVPGVTMHILRDTQGEVVVARTTLHTDPDFDAKQGRPLQLFGLTEFVEADEVSEALFDAICAAGRRAGKAGTFGPASLLPNQSGGVITSGYDDRGFIDSAWNHPYYPAAYERYGFTRRFEADTWICPLTGERHPDEIFDIDDTRLAAEGPAAAPRRQEAHHPTACDPSRDAQRELRAARVLHPDLRRATRPPDRWALLPA
jgi:hypothetical protein